MMMMMMMENAILVCRFLNKKNGGNDLLAGSSVSAAVR